MVEEGRVIGGQQPSSKKWVRRWKRASMQSHPKWHPWNYVSGPKALVIDLVVSLPMSLRPILKEWNLFNNLINYFNNFDIITTQWWMHSKKPINLVLGILYLNYTLEVFFTFYKLILWNTTRLCILIIKHLKGVKMY